MRVVITEYASNELDIRTIRDQVFIVEQQVPREQEIDDRDPICLHALVYDQQEPIATGRLDLAKGKVGRVAVLEPYRRCGVGSLVMRALEQCALEAGLERIWFHAQLTAVPFYTSLGYRICSEEFVEANIRHVMMDKDLNSQTN
ncbi:MAG: GNAT family N-acetyltransferase [Planctomycetales bacterium]|nr:GNAT family N-acetyltransferase [Planctomycetales bacterium]